MQKKGKITVLENLRVKSNCVYNSVGCRGAHCKDCVLFFTKSELEKEVRSKMKENTAKRNAAADAFLLLRSKN